MYVTYNKIGKIVAYSDKARNVFDLSEDETQAEVGMEFCHIACQEGGLTFQDGQLLNAGEVIAKEIPKKEIIEDEIL